MVYALRWRRPLRAGLIALLSLGNPAGASEPLPSELGVADWCVHAGAPSVAPPVVDERGRVYVATTDGYVHSFERAGSYRWSYTFSGPIAGPIALGRENGTLWVGTTDRRVYALSSEGRLLWAVDTIAPVSTGLVRRRDGTLLFGGNRYLHAISSGGGARWRSPLGAYGSAPPALGAAGVAWVAAGAELLRVEGAWRVRRVALPGEAVTPPLPLTDGVAVLAGDELLVVGEDGQIRWSRKDVAVVSRASRQRLVVVSSGGEVVWLDAERRGAPTGPGQLLGAEPSAAPALVGETAYVPLRSGDVVGVRSQGGIVKRFRVADGPLRSLTVDHAGGRLLAAVLGGRICSVPLVQ